MKSKNEILKEVARCRKASELAKENGHYMSWQQLVTREKALLWCIDFEVGNNGNK